MKIHTLDTLADASRVFGEVVVIDIFRSSNTVMELLGAGVSEVIAVEDVDDARILGEKHPDWLLLGERKGVNVAGFHGGNSPVGARSLARGKSTAVLTTSGGTRVMRACRDDRFWIGSFRNAGALISRLEGYADVSLWAVGRGGCDSAEEDLACADFIAARLSGGDPDFSLTRDRLLGTPGAEQLCRLGQYDDLDYCLQVDVSELTPHRSGTIEGWPCLTS